MHNRSERTLIYDSQIKKNIFWCKAFGIRGILYCICSQYRGHIIFLGIFFNTNLEQINFGNLKVKEAKVCVASKKKKKFHRITPSTPSPIKKMVHEQYCTFFFIKVHGFFNGSVAVCGDSENKNLATSEQNEFYFSFVKTFNSLFD